MSMHTATTGRPVSLVVPVFNEEESLGRLYERVAEVCNANGYDWELLLVDDGSRDATPRILAELAAKDPRVVPVIFQRNFGQTAAMAAGIDHARHPVIVTLDADLQNDPADIPALLAKYDEGWDVVSGWRKDRKDKAVSRKLPSMIANRLIGNITGVTLNDYGCTLKVYRASILKQVRLYGELHRFIPALCAIVGARITELPVRHHAREFGKSKYGISRTFRVLLDLLTVKFLLRYATRPMHFFGMVSFAGFAGAALSGVLVLWMKFNGPFLPYMDMTGNPLLYLTILFVLAGVEFLAIGLLGEIMMRTWHESQGKPIYTLKAKPEGE